jgi:arginine deiminase
MKPLLIDVKSEIGKLNGVIIHVPGAEVENMTPENAERALYSDILNLSVAIPEYYGLKGVLQKYTKVFEVKELLTEVMNNGIARNELISKICKFGKIKRRGCNYLMDLQPDELAAGLIEGVEKHVESFTEFLSDEKYCVHPLPNLFFTRDASFTVHDKVMISKMASRVRQNEAFIMETIFNHHPAFINRTLNLAEEFDVTEKATIEGGDVLVASDNIVLVGSGARTSTQGIDTLVEYFKTQPGVQHIIVQELPFKPESFIHLDMTFTFLDKDKAMIYKPLILDSHRYLTVRITIDGNKVFFKEEENLLDSLKSLGIDLEPVYCGGNDQTYMEREQWHSGANFFAIKPGHVIGYEKNTRTLEAMNKAGFEIITAKEVIEGIKKLEDYQKAFITIKGNELSRGGGGARCMTMPVNRDKVDW